MSYNEARNNVAEKLGVPPKLLSYLFRRGIDKFYKEIEIPKKTGGLRKIMIPQNQLKSVQKEILKMLQKIYIENNVETTFSHGFEKNKSIISNARMHKNKYLVLNLDLEDFFGSFHFGRIRGYFEKSNNFQLSHEESAVLANLICYKGFLPQGASTSPIMTNMICHFLDLKLHYIAKKNKFTYTRYADDLTFSSNNIKTESECEQLLFNIEKQIKKAGFKINKSKTRLQFRNGSQKVTGLVVNKKVNVNNTYYKTTRAMANKLYREGSFNINGNKGTVNQLEGRFSFIDQLNFESNKNDKSMSTVKHGFSWGSDNRKDYLVNRREKSYQEFLFYKYFYANEKPIILTEGKTDITYLKAALKNMYQDYPSLIEKKDGKFNFKVEFMKRSKRFNYFFGYFEGGNGMKNIYRLFFHSPYKYYEKFYKKRQIENHNPVFLIFDNELVDNLKPLRSFINFTNLNTNDNIRFLEEQHYLNLDKNLYAITHQLMNDKSMMEIEDLFLEDVLNVRLNNKSFNRKDNADRESTFGKSRFSDYIAEHYKTINFENFKPMLDIIRNISDNEKNIRL
ncbi:retron Ec67 family RNA-directed DNA polymerase/endonuclease [Lactococcus lactis]|uniref:retron Ec67 family RNA-directed DNA polymerase/endonuclease n=1 Tax=Lactococcus lactis TaxID=1358 RepID=UPI0005139050|nr:retron Ec67 family RNA-directed DNA polymerase/endonuclease [Lactococcus lactis]KGF77889.1 Retron-type RNA-directed DNA polymerase [Lactococcus lactis]